MLAKYPVSHGLHTVLPVKTGEYVPIGQAWHADTPVALEKLPAPHNVHDELPADGEYLPVPHRSQYVLFDALLNCPAGQSRHTGDPEVGVYEPGEHVLQLDDADDMLDVDPALQFVHVLLFVVWAYIPAVHGRQDEAPLTGEK
jgi:hypothetical protein